jgi:glycosyltransferase involved in cell wall biosynthesis
MMPCYNSAHTLPMALASLVAQTYENWECLLVDDGSIDNPQLIIEQFNDERIKFFQLEKNFGRGVARQVALDSAKGKYLCMLDADDWYYPSKIQLQVEVMEKHPKLAICSSGMAIVNEKNDLIGVRSIDLKGKSIKIQGPYKKPIMPPFAHAPSIIRMTFAKQAKYDKNFLLAQDVDFLIKVILNRYYSVLSDPFYVYSELSATTLKKILAALKYTQKMYWKYYKQFPILSVLNIFKAATKSVLYRAIFGLGFDDWIIRHRSQEPDDIQKSNYENAKKDVMKVKYRIFHSTSSL